MCYSQVAKFHNQSCPSVKLLCLPLAPVFIVLCSQTVFSASVRELGLAGVLDSDTTLSVKPNHEQEEKHDGTMLVSEHVAFKMQCIGETGDIQVLWSHNPMT